MMQHEKDQLLALFQTEHRWCQEAEARDGRGRAVHFDDPDAVSWDLTGAACLLFGWIRAMELFPQLERQVVGIKHVSRHPFDLRNKDPQICSMVAVQEYNDRPDTTYQMIMDRLAAMTVYLPEAHKRTEQVNSTPPIEPTPDLDPLRK